MWYSFWRALAALFFLLVEISTSDDLSANVLETSSAAPATSNDKDIASSSPVCKNAFEDSIVNYLIEWIAENGGIVDERQNAKKESQGNVTSPHSVYATSFIPKGTTLLSVPWHLVIEPKDYSDTSGLCDMVDILHKELEANKRGKSKYGPFMRYLESLTDPIMIPSAWSQGGKDLLKSVLGKNLMTDVNAIDSDFRLWKKNCVKGSIVNNPQETAAALAIGYLSPDPSDSDFDWYQMVPFYDFYSPREDGQHNTKYGQDDDAEMMILIASRDIETGETIHTPLGYGETAGEERQFVHSGKIERRHSFVFTDPSASHKNKPMPVKFDLDRQIDKETGKSSYRITWVEGVRPHSRSYDQIEVELNRMKKIVTILPLDALYFLQPAAAHERRAIEEYAWTLIDALTALLDTRHDARPITPWAIRDYKVAGVNLGTYNLIGIEEDKDSKSGEEPFELFQDFDISDKIIGNENWKDMIEYRRKLVRPSLSFYVDKVARKRWLPTQGMPQAEQYVLKYGSELSETGNEEEEEETLQNLLPDEVDYAAKPSHHSEGVSVWLVSHDTDKNVTSFSSTARQLKADENQMFHKMNVAKALTKHLHAEADASESWILRNVKPGVVVEERFVQIDKFDRAPLEFNCFVIWGRLWVAQLNHIVGESRYAMSWLYRDGSAIEGKENIPSSKLEYVDFPHIVEMAETLGRNKDMFRVDIFVGLPASSPSLGANATRKERAAAVEYTINECEIYPTTSFKWWPQLAQDGARLWVAGYKMGNYRTVPNDEVPTEFLETGFLSEP